MRERPPVTADLIPLSSLSTDNACSLEPQISAALVFFVPADGVRAGTRGGDRRRAVFLALKVFAYGVAANAYAKGKRRAQDPGILEHLEIAPYHALDKEISALELSSAWRLS